jgi:membrane protein
MAAASRAPWRRAAAHPLRFTWQVLRRFRANRGLLLAGAVAYYALLSIVPLLILAVMVLTDLLGETPVFSVLGRYLGWLLPGQSAPLVGELQAFLLHRDSVGWVLLGSLVFFSTLAFSVLENAMAIIFRHRAATHSRHPVVSWLMPYLYVLFLGAGMLVVTVVATALQALGQQELHVFGRVASLGGFSGALLYGLGIGGEVLVLTSLYLVMPAGGLSWRHALLGAAVATVLWELSRHALVWYFATLSQIGRVYGSMTTAIAVLLSLEIAGTLLLLGAQVIAELERAEE